MFAKKVFFFQCLNRKKKTYFSFSLIILLNSIFIVLLHYLLPFFKQLRNSIFLKHIIFWVKNVSMYFSQSSRKLKYFPLRSFRKTKINGHPKVQNLVNMADESELLGQAVTIFAWSSKKHALFWWKMMHFLLTNSWWFSLSAVSAAFSWPNWEQYLLELIV